MAFVLPVFILPVSIWRWSSWGGVAPPGGPADVTATGNLTPGLRVVVGGSFTFLGTYVLVPKNTDVRFSETGIFATLPASDPDLIEIPSGSARFYSVLGVENVAMGFHNEHLVCGLVQVSPWPNGPVPGSGSFLLEGGGDILLESVGSLLLE